jgi:hypothetical protein
MSSRILSIACLIGLAAASAQVPQLSVVSATSTQVQLTWTAVPGASYTVLRVPTVVTSSGIPGSTLNISMAIEAPALGKVSTTSWTDTSFDPSTTYTYFVSVGNNQVSNQVMVGPPPFGFNVVVPSTSDNCESAAIMERMELDGNGDPAMAYVVLDPNGDGDESDDTIYFVSWNRAGYAWNPPVVVAVPAYLDEVSEGPTMPLSLARDAATGMWGIAYNQSFPDGNGTIALATSTDGGVTWTSQSISGSPFGGWLYTPSLALWNGSFYAVFLTDNTFFGPNLDPFPQGSGFVYVTGKVTDASSNWTRQVVPYPGDYNQGGYYTVSLALDSNHAPGIAFNVDDDTYEGVAFWRPGTSVSTLIAHNDGYTTNDNPSISLTFFGTIPEVATDAPWNYNSFDPDHEPADLWAMRAMDSAGLGWLPAVDVPPDNVNMMEMPWIASGSQGQTAIAMASNKDPEGQGMVCGFPKIARSPDFLTFQTCAPATMDSPSFAPNNAHPVLHFGANDKLWLAF